jgi:hypothetical protein
LFVAGRKTTPAKKVLKGRTKGQAAKPKLARAGSQSAKVLDLHCQLGRTESFWLATFGHAKSPQAAVTVRQAAKDRDRKSR